MEIYQLLSIFIFHWIFDFFLQSERVAKGKSKSNIILLEHSTIYFIGIILMSIILGSSFNSPMPNLVFWGFINVIAHFFTDWVTSRATSLLYEKERYHDFFVVIGFDQLIHYTTLLTTFVWLSNL